LGMGRSKFLLMTARRIGAEEAERWGLISLCVSHEKLEQRVNDLMNRLLKLPPCPFVPSSLSFSKGRMPLWGQP